MLECVNQEVGNLMLRAPERWARSVDGVTELGAPRARFLHKSLIVGVGNVISRALGFLYPIALTWILTQRDYGLVRYVIATATLAGQVLFSGFPTTLARYLGRHTRDPERQAAYIVNTCLINALLTLIVMAGLVPLLKCLDRFHWEILMVLAGLVIDFTFFAILRGQMRAASLAVYVVSSKALQIAGILCLYLLFGYVSPQLALAMYSFNNLPPLVLIAARGSLNIRFDLDLISPHLAWEVTRFTAPLLVNAVAYGILMGLDSFLIRAHYGFEAVAVYEAGKIPIVLFSFVPFAVTTVLMPAVAELNSWDAAERYIRLSLLMCGAASAALLVLLVSFSRQIVAFLFPQEYGGSSQVVAGLALGGAAFYLYTILSQTWTGLGKPHIPAVILSFAAATNVILNILLLPRLGLQGAAMAFSASSLLGLIGLGVATRYSLGRARDGGPEGGGQCTYC